MNKVSLPFILLLFLFSFFQSLPVRAIVFDSTQDSSTNILRIVVNNYHQGFIDKNLELVRNSIGSQLIMINGNFSGNPSDWQAHQFLINDEINEWINMMLNNAGPFENQVVVKSINERNSSALVTTREVGKNKFRSWDDEEVAYMMGKIDNNWKIVGVFIKNVKNPE